jgi:hypothetical protein
MPMIQKDPVKAFERAISERRMSERPTDWNYSAQFTYEGSIGELDLFRHIATGEYLDDSRSRANHTIFKNHVERSICNDK